MTHHHAPCATEEVHWSTSSGLGEGHYHWHHDQVLKEIAETIHNGIAHSKHLQPARQAIAFSKAGEKPQPTVSAGLFGTAQDWQLKADLGKQLRFSEIIAATTQKAGHFAGL